MIQKIKEQINKYHILLWSILITLLVFFGTTPDTQFIWRSILIFASVYIPLILFDDRSHAIHNFNTWKQQWLHGIKPQDTEMLTSWLWPKLWKDTPNDYWSETEFLGFHMSGQGFIGMVRNAPLALVVLGLVPWFSLVYILSGICYPVINYFYFLTTKDDIEAIWRANIMIAMVQLFIIGMFIYVV